MSRDPIRIGLGMLPHPDGPHATSGYASYTARLQRHMADDEHFVVVPLLEPASRWGPASPHRVIRAAHRRLARSRLVRSRIDRDAQVRTAEVEYTAPHLASYSDAGERAIELMMHRIRRARLDVLHIVLTGTLGTAPFEACRRLGVPYVATVVDYGPICAQGIMRERDERICTGPESTAKCSSCLAALGRDADEDRIERRRLAYAHYYGHATRVFTFTRSHADLLSRWLGIAEDRFAVTPFAVPAAGPGFRKAPDAFTRPLHFAYVARTCPEWGVADLVEAWRRAALDPAHAVLDIHTDAGFERSGLAASSVDLIDSGALMVSTDRVADRLDELHAHTAAVVVPSQWRNTGSSSGLEALARATPVVTNDEFGMYEDLPPAMRRLAYPTGDVDALATRLRELADDPAVLEALSHEVIERSFAEHVAPLLSSYREASRGR
jgi:glycosyltransferase involved in cell wall biosynthesis